MENKLGKIISEKISSASDRGSGSKNSRKINIKASGKGAGRDSVDGEAGKKRMNIHPLESKPVESIKKAFTKLTEKKVPTINQGKKRTALVMDAFKVDYYKTDTALDLKMKEFTKIPFTEISTMGSAFSSVVTMLQEAAMDLSPVDLSKGGKLVRAVGVDGFRAINFGKTGLEQQAIFLKTGRIGVSMSTLFLSIALMGIQKELKQLTKMQTELLEIIERDKKSQLLADMQLLREYTEDYKYYWDNAATLTANLNQVKNIKRNAGKDMLSYREEVEDILNGKMETAFNHGAAAKVNKLSERFAYYRLALYVYSYAAYLEVLLAQNFNSEYLQSVHDDLRRLFDDYRELYTDCYNEIETTAKTALGAHVANTVAAANKFLGRQLGKIGFIRNSGVDDLLEANGSSISQKEEERLSLIGETFAGYRDCGIDVFTKNLDFINKSYNKPVELLWDSDNLYVGPAETT